MTDQLSGSDAVKAIGDPFGTFVGWLVGLLPEGPARTLLYVVAGLCVLAAPFIYKYYLGVLAQGMAPQGSIERQDYDKLRASLAGGNLAARLYAKWLTAFLDWIERFFGDAGMADRTLFPHAFGLETPVPTWTAPALDRCLRHAMGRARLARHGSCCRRFRSADAERHRRRARCYDGRAADMAVSRLAAGRPRRAQSGSGHRPRDRPHAQKIIWRGPQQLDASLAAGDNVAKQYRHKICIFIQRKQTIQINSFNI
jgi:hypothetical protein